MFLRIKIFFNEKISCHIQWFFWLRTLTMQKTLKIHQDQSFGIITKLLVHRANEAEPRISHA